MGELGKCIGLVGGLGVGAAVHYYQELAKAHVQQGRVMDLTMAQADNGQVRTLIEAGDKRGLARYLAELIGRTQAAGAEFAVVPAVAPHIAIAELTEISPLPMVSLITELRLEVQARGLRRVSMFGTRYAVESRLFGQLGDVEVVVPQPDEVDFIHTTYFNIVDAGGGSPEQRAALTSLAHKLMERERVEAILLAGTDLALVFNESNADFPHVDAARVHLDAIVERALA